MNTPLPHPNSQNGRPFAYYFRTSFEWTNESYTAAFQISNVVANGVVLYLNGHELYRGKMPDGEIRSDTFAYWDPDGAGFFTNVGGVVRPGVNVLAAEAPPRRSAPGYSIRINDQWRICYRWLDGDAWDVEIADYH